MTNASEYMYNLMGMKFKQKDLYTFGKFFEKVGSCLEFMSHDMGELDEVSIDNNTDIGELICDLKSGTDSLYSTFDDISTAEDLVMSVYAHRLVTRLFKHNSEA